MRKVPKQTTRLEKQIFFVFELSNRTKSFECNFLWTRINATCSYDCKPWLNSHSVVLRLDTVHCACNSIPNCYKAARSTFGLQKKPARLIIIVYLDLFLNQHLSNSTKNTHKYKVRQRGKVFYWFAENITKSYYIILHNKFQLPSHSVLV